MEEFEQRVFWISIHPKGRRLAKAVWTADRAVFDDDFALIRALARTSSYEEFKAELLAMRREHPIRGFIRDTLHVRTSGRALLTVASKLFGEYFRPTEETDPSMDTSFLTERSKGQE